MPIDAYPGLDELIWLFEVEPEVHHEDLGWPASAATFRTTRGPWTLVVEIAPYMYTVEISLRQNTNEVVRLAMKEVVRTLSIDRTHGIEALVVGFDRNSRLDALRLTLKPDVYISFDTTRIWDA